jgi:endonuclease/exonuclease/phosphatase family metal-dependent hydrolase
LKRFLRTGLIVFTVLLALAYGLASLTPLISPARWVLMGFLALGFPVLLLLLSLLVVTWFFIRRKIALLLLLLLACGSYHIFHLFGFHAGKFSVAKPPGTVRIMGWNVQNFATGEKYLDTFNSVRHRLFRYIQRQQPDILCLQDFLEYKNAALPSNIDMLADSLHYPHYFVSNDYVEYPPWGPSYTGIAIFSKYPLKNVNRIPYTGKKVPESIITADVTINGRTRRLIVTHLQSMHLRYSKPTVANPWKVAYEDSTLNEEGTLYDKLSFYLPYHAQQAILVKKIINESPWPVIFSADMNEVPSSWCYYKIKSGLKDAFLVKGNGLGRTYTAISPTLRIDYLMASAGIEIRQYLSDTVHFSDHYPQLVDVKW